MIKEIKMKKLMLLSILLVVGCSPTVDDTSDSWKLPHDLKQCKVIEMEKGGGSSKTIVLIKCPEGYLGATISKYNPNTKITESTTTVIYQNQ